MTLTRQTPNRRTALQWMAAAAAGPAALPVLHAADFPERQVRIVNPTAPGGTVDMVARIMGEKMGPHLGQQVVVEHRPGGSGAIGASLVAKGPKDGYMMFIGTSSTLGFMKMLNKELAYEPVKDFTPVSLVGSVPIGVFTSGTSGIRTIQELVAAAKAKPGELSYGSSGTNSLTHLAGELLCQRAGIEMIHVPYTGAQQGYWSDVMGGRLVTTMQGVTGGLALAKEGKLNLIAVASRERSRLLPDVPAIGEVYSGFDVPAWFGLAVAAGTPANVVQKLESAAMAALRDPSTRTQLAAIGVELGPILTADAFSTKIGTDNQMWEKTFRNAGLMK